MPYKTTWEPASKDESLPVLKELPEGYREHKNCLVSIRLANKSVHDAYFCIYCDGWILGDMSEYDVNTWETKGSREGREYYCRRCGKELGFVGTRRGT